MSFAAELRNNVNTCTPSPIPYLRELMIQNSKLGSYSITVKFQNHAIPCDYTKWTWTGGNIPYWFYSTVLQFCKDSQLRVTYTSKMQIEIDWTGKKDYQTESEAEQDSDIDSHF